MLSPKLLTLVSAYHLLALTITSALCAVWWPHAAAAVFAGGLVMAGNFWALRKLAERILEPGRRRLFYALLLAGKLVVAMGAIALVLTVFHGHAAGFALGMATLFVGLGLAMVHNELTQAPGSAV